MVWHCCKKNTIVTNHFLIYEHILVKVKQPGKEVDILELVKSWE